MHVLLSAVLALLVTTADAQTVMEGVFRRQDVLDNQNSCAHFNARLRYVESDLKSGDSRCVEYERRVTIPKFDSQVHEFGSVWVDGQLVQGRERQKEIDSLVSKGVFAQETHMPFFPETRDEYDYTVARQDTWRGMQIWQVDFIPKRATKRHITGSALVLHDTYDIVSLEFVPSDLPFVVMDAGMKLDYELVSGRWVPVSFEMDMDLRLAFIIELMRRNIRIEDVYWNYAFTSADSLQSGKGD